MPCWSPKPDATVRMSGNLWSIGTRLRPTKLATKPDVCLAPKRHSKSTLNQHRHRRRLQTFIAKSTPILSKRCANPPAPVSAKGRRSSRTNKVSFDWEGGTFDLDIVVLIGRLACFESGRAAGKITIGHGPEKGRTRTEFCFKTQKFPKFWLSQYR